MQISQVALDFLAIDTDLFTIQENPHHTSRQSVIARDALPHMIGSSLDRDVVLAHDAFFARVQSELEDALDERRRNRS